MSLNDIALKISCGDVLAAQRIVYRVQHGISIIVGIDDDYAEACLDY